MDQHDYHKTHIRVSEAAKMLRLSRNAILMAIARGKLPAIKDPGRTGRRWISPADLSNAYPGYKRHLKGPRPKQEWMSERDALAWLQEEAEGAHLLRTPEQRAEALKRLRE